MVCLCVGGGGGYLMAHRWHHQCADAVYCGAGCAQPQPMPGAATAGRLHTATSVFYIAPCCHTACIAAHPLVCHFALLPAEQAYGASGGRPCCCRQVSAAVTHLLYPGSRRRGQDQDPRQHQAHQCAGGFTGPQQRQDTIL